MNTRTMMSIAAIAAFAPGIARAGHGAMGTFSIVAADPATGEVGVAVQSKYFCVGAVVPHARAGVGAVATQAAGVTAYGPRILDLLAGGMSPEKALETALADDADKETRQLGVVDAKGRTANWTGAKCNAWAGSSKGVNYSAQGNILAGEAVVREMGRAFEAAKGSMAEKLMAAIEGGQAAGGDKRGQQSAALIVERKGAAKEGREGVDRIVDLRVDDSTEPIKELRRLLGIRLRWEVLQVASGCYQKKDFAKGAAVLADGLIKFPDDPTILYDLACYECLAGRTTDALAHLERALTLDPKSREMAKGDSDFDSVKSSPEFKKLTTP